MCSRWRTTAASATAVRVAPSRTGTRRPSSSAATRSASAVASAVAATAPGSELAMLRYIRFGSIAKFGKLRKLPHTDEGAVRVLVEIPRHLWPAVADAVAAHAGTAHSWPTA
jgi:hypothetical protein